jgi:hypothetical protein
MQILQYALIKRDRSGPINLHKPLRGNSASLDTFKRNGQRLGVGEFIRKEKRS